MRNPGQARRSASASDAQPASWCSHLSSTSSSSLPSSWLASVSIAGRSADGNSLSPPTTACGTMAGSAIGARLTKHAPSANCAWCRLATSRQSRVLPTPPGPVSVSNRVLSSTRASSAICGSRPTKLVSSGGSSLGGRRAGSSRCAGDPACSSRRAGGPAASSCWSRARTRSGLPRRCSARSQRATDVAVIPNRSVSAACVRPTARRRRRSSAPDSSAAAGVSSGIWSTWRR